MATPPSMANEPAASEATPLVAMEEVELLVGVGSAVTMLVMVVWWLTVAERLPRMVDEVMVDVGTEKLVVELELMTVEVSVELDVEVSDSEAVALAVALAVVLVESLPPSETIWKGKPYWKTVTSDSRVIMIP